MAVRRIVVLAGWSLLCTASVGRVQGQGPAAGQDVVAVVLSGAGAAVGSIAISYPGVVERGLVDADLAAVAGATGWCLSMPSVSVGAGETTAMATMQPGPGSDARYGEPVFPAVWALRRYRQIGVTVLGSGFQAPVGLRQNRFISVMTSGGGGVWQYQVIVGDRSFRALDELRTLAPAGAAADRSPQRGGTARPWPLIVALALALGGLVFVLAMWLVGRGRPRRSHPGVGRI